MLHSTARLVFIAQLSLFAFLFICFLLMPHFLLESNEGGVSNYGIHTKTIVPYTLGFGICGLLTIQSARVLPKAMARRHLLRWALFILGSLYIFVLISTYPYKLNATLGNVHHGAGAALVIFSLIFGAWLALGIKRDTTSILLFSAQCAGFLLVALTFFGLVHILFIAELLTSAAFGVLLAIRTKRLSDYQN